MGWLIQDFKLKIMSFLWSTTSKEGDKKSAAEKSLTKNAEKKPDFEEDVKELKKANKRPLSPASEKQLEQESEIISKKAKSGSASKNNEISSSLSSSNVGQKKRKNFDNDDDNQEKFDEKFEDDKGDGGAKRSRQVNSAAEKADKRVNSCNIKLDFDETATSLNQSGQVLDDPTDQSEALKTKKKNVEKRKLIFSEDLSPRKMLKIRQKEEEENITILKTTTTTTTTAANMIIKDAKALEADQKKSSDRAQHLLEAFNDDDDE